MEPNGSGSPKDRAVGPPPIHRHRQPAGTACHNGRIAAGAIASERAFAVSLERVSGGEVVVGHVRWLAGLAGVLGYKVFKRARKRLVARWRRERTRQLFEFRRSTPRSRAGPMGGTTSSRAGEGPIIMFGGTADTVVNYANWQIRTCDQHKAKGNICEFVSYPGAHHTQPAHTQGLLDRSAAFVYQHVLTTGG
jgi:hypothetical protein